MACPGVRVLRSRCGERQAHTDELLANKQGGQV
eukprot:COSAG01_NODE_45818_length_406_cov_0.508143_1_plen_32_part_01